MKKAIFLIVAILLITTGASAQRRTKSVIKQAEISPTAYINLSAPTTGALAGSNFTIPVTVSDMTGLDVIAYQFDLHYDPTVIQPQTVPVTSFGTLSNGMAVVYNPFAPGILKVAVYGATAITGAGTLFNLQFKAVGAEGSVSSLTWVNMMFNEGNPGVYAKNGQIRITSQAGNPTPVSFAGRETLAGTFDSLNQVYRNNTFVLASDDVTNASSMTASFDMISAEEAGQYKIVDGQWTVMVYENGLYVGSVYGDFFDGRVTQLEGTPGNVTTRMITSRFRIRGGIGRFENIAVDDTPSGEFNSVTDYTNGKRTTATLSYLL